MIDVNSARIEVNDWLPYLTAFVLIASLLINALNSKLATDQRRITNEVAAFNTASTAVNHAHLALQSFVDEPDLRTYFYDGRAVPADAQEYGRVATLAEMLADSIEVALDATLDSNAFSKNRESWQDYAWFILANSPMMRELITQHPQWYPRLTEELTGNEYQAFLASL